MPNWKKLIVSGSDAFLNSLNVNSGVTGSLFGTASYALTASYFNGSVVSASYTATASYVLPLRQTVELTGSLNITSSNSFALNLNGDTVTNGVIKFTPTNKSIDNSISGSYIYVSGSTNDLYFAQNTAGYANAIRLRWLESNLYTGLLSGGVMSSTYGSTTFNVSAGSGVIVSLNAFTASADPYPTVQYVSWPTQTALPIQNSGSAKITYVSINSSGTVLQQIVPIGSTDGNQWDTQIELGVVLHLSGSVSTGVYNAPQVSYGYAQRTDDFLRAFGPIKVSGHTLQASGSTLSITKTAGTAYNNGANYTTNPNHPSLVTEAAVNTSKIYRYYTSGSTTIIDTGVANAGYAVIDPSKYVNTTTGLLTSVPGGGYTIQRVFWFPNSPTNAFIVYYGNDKYNSSTDAVTAILSEPFTEAPNTAQNAILVAYIIASGGESNLQNATIIQGGLFRSVNGIGASNTTPISSTFAGLSDVSVASRTTGDLLTYNGSQWVNTKTLTGNYSINGNLTITGSIIGTASYALTASYFNGSIIPSASYATTASYVLNSISSSYSSTASYVVTSLTASYYGGSVVSSSYAVSSSYVLNAISSSFSTSALTASYLNTLNQNLTFNGNLTLNGTASISYLNVQYETASVIYSSGSNQFGDASNDTQTLWGTVDIKSGPVQVTGSVTATSFTGSLFGTSSWALNALTASYYAGSVISSSYAATASYYAGSVISASYAGTASYSTTLFASTSNTGGSLRFYGSDGGIIQQINTLTASLALTASYYGGSVVSSSYAATASYWNGTVVSSSYALTASYASVAQTLLGSVTSASYALTASYVNPLVQDVRITGALTVSGSSKYVSIGTNVSSSVLNIYKSGSTVIDIQGSQGQLFSVVDSLSGSLMSVNDISGLPILEVFSDNTVKMGSYTSPALYTTKKITSTAGVNTIYTLPTASYDGVFMDYTIKSGSNARAGQFVAVWSGLAVNFSETTTTNFGTTSGVTFGANISGANLIVSGSTSTATWTIKTILRAI
jgi:hypothetical protein